MMTAFLVSDKSNFILLVVCTYMQDNDWNQALFHEAMTKAVNAATASRPSLVLTA